jgi:GDPmannose 4,6-dehydratase
MPSALITGVNGQDGSYLAEWLLGRGYEVIGLVREDAGDRLDRIRHLRSQLQIVQGSLLDDALLRRVLEQHRPDEVYNFAARASSSQLLTDPTLTAEYNGLAVVRMLEAIRTVNPQIRICQASSSEMFGAVSQSPQNELTPFRPRNPYGVAKLFAHGMVGTYRENFGVFGCSAILFNHESPRRGPEFVTRKISLSVARIRAGLARSLLLGDLDVTRDWGFAGDYVRAMWQMLQAEVADDYVVATGVSHSVREFCELAFERVGLDYRAYVQTDPQARRAPESIPFVGDASKARRELGWQPSLSFEQLVTMMVDADMLAEPARLDSERA